MNNTNLNEAQSAETDVASAGQAERCVMRPYIKNRADGVNGHYCIGRETIYGYHEFWNDKLQKWCSAGTVFKLGVAL